MGFYPAPVLKVVYSGVMKGFVRILNWRPLLRGPQDLCFGVWSSSQYHVS